MESSLGLAVQETISRIEQNFNVQLQHDGKLYLKDIVSDLADTFKNVDFFYNFETSFLKPDGGLLYICDTQNKKYPILISEAKRQGTNDLREAEGLKKQAQGNAIERLGKNVTGLRIWMTSESIFPFVVFGEGVDFASESSILDRVSTVAMFAPLNKIELNGVGDEQTFKRGSFFFREQTWSVAEMVEIMYKISSDSIAYYFAKYGSERFESIVN